MSTRSTQWQRRWIGGLLLLFWLVGCARQPTVPRDPGAVACERLYRGLAGAVDAHGVSPSSPAPLPGFPQLALDRFHVQLGQWATDPSSTGAWLARLESLGAERRAVQLASLPEGVRADLALGDTAQALTDCATVLTRRDRQDPARLARLRAARVADDYHTTWRVLGLYPLSSLPVQAGVARYHAETRVRFDIPLMALPVVGELRRYRSPPGNPVIAPLPRDELDVPVADATQLSALFHRHAPVWEVDTAGAFDRIGVPYWRAPGVSDVDPATPVVYRHVSYSFWQERPVLQLNYLVWFAARPPEKPLDILAGRLDGVHWRVTLDHDGEALVYDTIHPCGCYHMLFPTDRLRPRPDALRLREPPLIPQPAPRPAPDERLVLRIASGSHYIQRVYADRPAGRVVEFRPYRALYRIVDADGSSASLFGEGGLVAGTERAERWLLWPMGIASPGAMRERGRHAIAFVGRRHFDDPDLLERFFRAVLVSP